MMEEGRWRMEDGGRRTEDGVQRMEYRGWRMKDRGRRMEDGEEKRGLNSTTACMSFHALSETLYRKNVLLTSKECLPSCCNAFLQYVGLSVNLSVMYSNYVSVENYPYYSILPPQTSVFQSSYGTV